MICYSFSLSNYDLLRDERNSKKAKKSIINFSQQQLLVFVAAWQLSPLLRSSDRWSVYSFQIRILDKYAVYIMLPLLPIWWVYDA